MTIARQINLARTDLARLNCGILAKPTGYHAGRFFRYRLQDAARLRVCSRLPSFACRNGGTEPFQKG